MPLDQAVYSPSNNKIYGIRGQYIYQFNATTAAMENAFRWVSDAIWGDSSIVVLNGVLYASYWRRVANPMLGASSRGDIRAIDLGLTTSTALGLQASSASGPGFGNLVTDGTFIYGTVGYSTDTTRPVFMVDPLNIPTFDFSTYGENYPVIDLIIDTTALALCRIASGGLNAPKLDGWEVSAGSFGTQANVSAATPQIFGGTRYPAAQKIYCVGNNRNVVKFNWNLAVATLPAAFGAATWTTLTNLLAVGATPIRCKFNPADSLIYIPTWNGDTVEVLDPTTDTITAIKTGFSSPIDMVFTPTKKFAVQNSAVGLKEVI